MFDLQLYVFSAILLLLFPTQSTTFAVFKGPCPTNITSIGKFDMKKYLGKWYTYSSYPKISGDNKMLCKSSEFKESNSDYLVIRKELSPFTQTLKSQEFKITDVDTDVGKFVMLGDNKDSPYGMEMYILDTDYDNFAVQYACIDSESVFNIQTAAIYTRKQKPSSETIFTAQKIAQLSDIKMDLMVKVRQEACPADT